MGPDNYKLKPGGWEPAVKRRFETKGEDPCIGKESLKDVNLRPSFKDGPRAKDSCTGGT